MCAVDFRGRLEAGLICGTDDAPPGTKLKPLLPAVDATGWGQQLLRLCRLHGAHPHELAGYLLFDTPAKGLRLYLDITAAENIPATHLALLGKHGGKLTPGSRKALATGLPAETLAELVASGAVGFRSTATGTPGETRAKPALARFYALDEQTSQLLGLAAAGRTPLPGSYLAGLMSEASFPEKTITRRQLPPEPQFPLPPAQLCWEKTALPADWWVSEMLPGLTGLQLERTFSNWPQLGPGEALAAEVLQAVAAGETLLVMAPQDWMLERIWPQLSPRARRIHRYHATDGPSSTSHLLSRLQSGGQAVLGLEAAAKLAHFHAFNRIIIIDPQHPHFAPEGAPWFSPVACALDCAARQESRVQFIELAVSALDGRTPLEQVALLPLREAGADDPPRATEVSMDPLPLELGQPGRRRLVYLNRLGKGRSLSCVECFTPVNCPRCGSKAVFYSGKAQAYRCPACGWEQADLRCRTCGMAMFRAQVAGVEALARRPGDALVYRSAADAPHPERQSVFGTAALLTPQSGFWPQDIIYIHAQSRIGLIDDWPQAVDMAARLAALYANPQLEHVYIVSQRLPDTLGKALSREQIQAAFKQETGLRRLAGLPPSGCICRFRLRGENAQLLATAGRELGEWLKAADSGCDCRTSRPFRFRDGLELSGYAINPAPGWREWQEYRARLRRQNLSLLLHFSSWPWL